MKEETREEITLKPGERKSICTCGYSKILPYCDNQHRVINERDDTCYKSLKVENPTDRDITIKLECGNWKKGV